MNGDLVAKAASAIRDLDRITPRPLTAEDQARAVLQCVTQRSGVLEQIIREIKRHDAEHPDHGIGCACHDAHAGALRHLFDAEGLYDKTPSGFWGSTKSMRNLCAVLGYVTRNP